jgi:hypothetical protein
MEKKKIVVFIDFKNGFPSKKTIVCLLHGFGIESEFFQFIHEDEDDINGVTKIIWKSKQISRSMTSFVKFLEFNRIEVHSVKIDDTGFCWLKFVEKKT